MPSRGMVIVTGDDSEEDTQYYSADHDNNKGMISTNIANRLRERIGISKSAKQVQREKPPLRILVIGDSLAAGVGTSKSSTPVLPESIALALSKALGGRPVYWICTGIPGCTASEIVDEIYQLDDQITNDESQLTLLDKLQDWQIEMKIRANKGYEVSKLKAKQWLEKRHNDDFLEGRDDNHVNDHNNKSGTHEDEASPDSASKKSKWGKFVVWIQRTRQQLTRDIHDIKEVIVPTSDTVNTKNDLTELAIQKEIILRKSNISSHTVKRRNSIDPNVVGKYDIAVVLTGLNDLKESFLPFMVDARKKKQREWLAKQYQQQHRLQYDELLDDKDGNNEEEKEPDGLKRELLRILDALQNKMKAVRSSFPQNYNQKQTNSNENHDMEEKQQILSKDQTKDNLHAGSKESRMTSSIHNNAATNIEDRSYWRHDNSPIVVFPALPYAPIELTKWVPLCWFIVPLLRSIDRHKELLAQTLPGLVLYVDSPNNEVIRDAEMKRGPLWDGFDTEKIHLKITDVKQLVQERILDSMKQHYDAWIKKEKREGNDNSYDVDDNGTNADDDSMYHIDDNESKFDTRQINDQSNTKKKSAGRDDELYEMDLDGVNVINKKQHPKEKHVGSTMLAPDGIHPNDGT